MPLAAKGPSKGTGLFSEDLRELLRERTQDAKALLGASRLARETTYNFGPHKRGSTLEIQCHLDDQTKGSASFFGQPPLPTADEGAVSSHAAGEASFTGNPRQAGQRIPTAKEAQK